MPNPWVPHPARPKHEVHPPHWEGTISHSGGRRPKHSFLCKSMRNLDGLCEGTGIAPHTPHPILDDKASSIVPSSFLATSARTRIHTAFEVEVSKCQPPKSQVAAPGRPRRPKLEWSLATMHNYAIGNPISGGFYTLCDQRKARNISHVMDLL